MIAPVKKMPELSLADPGVSALSGTAPEEPYSPRTASGGPSGCTCLVEISAHSDRWSNDQTMHEFLEHVVRTAVRTAFGSIRSSDTSNVSLPHEVSILLTGDDEISQLNETHRGRRQPTNVLSFPSGLLSGTADLAMTVLPLGDIALAYETIEREAVADAKPFNHHVAHLTVHGVLHLFGFDHDDNEDAERMEALEVAILDELSIPNPYETVRPETSLK